ncbi:ABC transporter ATP-binding protein [Halorubellus litoreus]|uniref:ABC transporter ATP-binding protein n=1 Tax=Halorubellus litoreus TaxID=755308 RepID=A0ABD5VPE7_9EURY
MALLEIEDLHTGYGDVPVLEGVDLEVADEEIVGVVGPNGAGKSTIFKAIMGYLEPWSGSIRYQGREIGGTASSDLVKEGIGYVPQNDNVFPKMTVEENLRMGAFTVTDDEYERNVEPLLELFPKLQERLSQKVYKMSGGEQKMVAVARALVTAPDLVLFDEPSAGLMPKYVDDIFRKVRQIQEERDISLLIIEQNVPKLLENSDRAYVIRDGGVRLEAESRRLLEDEDLGAAYLGGSEQEV